MTTTDFPPGETNRPWPTEWPEWLGTFPRLTGRQWPEFECWHPGDETEGDRTAKFGKKLGVHLLPWEWMVIRGFESRQPVNADGIALFTHRVAVLEATRQQGKALDVSTPILTTAGWSTMGEIRVGDEVFHPDGHPSRVIGAFDVMQDHRCYEVTTTDGRKIVADADHLWTVQDRRREVYPPGRKARGHFAWETLTTRQLLDRGLMRSEREFAFRLPRQHAIVSKPVDLPIDPYLLGVWLGDGCSTHPVIFSGDQDVEEMAANLRAAGARIVSSKRTRTCWKIAINIEGAKMRDGFTSRLIRLDVRRNKHVPPQYLTAGSEQRLALLQGLLDTDGSISREGQVEFCSVNRQLAEDVLYLARSLGWRPAMREGRATINGRDCGTKYRVRFTPDASEAIPFRLARKAERVRALKSRGGERHCISIRSIVEVESRPVRCIKVEREDGLFLAGRDLMPTHNTLALALLIIRRLFKHRRRMVYTAQQYATVEDVFDRVVAIIERSPSLMRRLAAEPTKKDNRPVLVLKPEPGDKHVVKANFGPRTQHFARGFTELDDVIFDEAYDLVPREVANLTGAQAASNNAQTIYVSTPPVLTAHPNCQRFSGLVRTIENGGAPGLYGALYRAPKSFKRGDVEAYPLAQPSYGVVNDDREMEAHLQGAKDAGPEDLLLFDADWLGWGMYPPPSNRRESEIPAEKWRDMRNPSPSLTGRPVVVLTREQSWAITAAQRTTDGRIHLEVGYTSSAPGSVVVSKFVELCTAWNPAAVVVSPGEAAEVIPELELAGIEVIVPNRTERAQACGGFLQDAISPANPPLLSHSGQSGLTTAVDNAVKKELAAGGFIWEIHDIASYPQLMGATLARWALLKHGKPVRKRGPKPAYDESAAGSTTTTWAAIGDHFNPMTANF